MQDFTTVVEANKKLEEEKTALLEQVAELRKYLDDHFRSGKCLRIKSEISGDAATIPATPTASSLTSSCSMTGTPFPAPLQQQEPSVEELVVDSDVYLQGFEGSISPEHTFTDLELDKLVNLGSILAGSDAGIPSLPAATIPVPDLPGPARTACLPQSDPMADLKTLMPSSPNTSCSLTHSLFSPISPPAAHDRHCSVSSVASDWSSISDRSPAFGLVPGQGLTEPTLPELGRSSVDLAGARDDAPGELYHQVQGYGVVAMDCEDVEDEVFGAGTSLY